MVNNSSKSAMSLTEVLVSFACVGILAMILIPALLKSTNYEKEKYLYKKAVNTMQKAIGEVISDYEAVNASNFLPELTQNVSLREKLASKFNTNGGLRSIGTGSSSAANPDFYSQDGMIWWGVPATWPEGNNFVDVHVDINGYGGKNKSSTDVSLTDSKNIDRLRVRLWKDGRIVAPPGSIEEEYLTGN